MIVVELSFGDKTKTPVGSGHGTIFCAATCGVNVSYQAVAGQHLWRVLA